MEISLTRFKVCTKCGCTKLATKSFFHARKNRPSGLRNPCKVCAVLDRQKYVEENRAAVNQAARLSRINNPEAHRERTRKWREENPEHIRRYRDENREKIREAGREYYKNNKHKIQEWRDANKEYLSEYWKRYRLENLETITAYQKQYCAENREAKAEYDKLYRAENLEDIAERNRRYYSENAEFRCQQARQWAKDNPDKRRTYNRKRRAQKLNAEHEPYSGADLNAMWYEQGGLCAYCKCLLFGNLHVDHVIPLSRGGADRLSNLALACPTCNLRKNAKTGEEFMKVLREVPIK